MEFCLDEKKLINILNNDGGVFAIHVYDRLEFDLQYKPGEVMKHEFDKDRIIRLQIVKKEYYPSADFGIVTFKVLGKVLLDV